MQQQLKKIVIIGPESTGKSTLTRLLAEHYCTEWCEEYAREYLLTNGTNYSYQDLLTIAKGQLELEDSYQLSVNSKQLSVNDSRLSTFNSRLLFIDTDMYVMKVWCEYVFGKCHPYIEEQIAERKYDLYLLCNIDLPWVKDELREYPDEAPRRELYAIYKNILQNQSVPWVDISGNYEERLQKAIEAVDGMG
jgi:NadR type nicotinamide-nucleotide adenylyltransferase